MSLLQDVINLVFPINCVDCGSEGDWLCDTCRRRLTVVRPQQCALCGKAANNGICQACQKKTRIDGIVSLFSYRDEPVKRLVKSLKYGGYTDVARFTAGSYSRQVIRLLPEGLVSTAVPLEYRREAARGFNQAELLASQLFNAHPLSLFIKQAATKPQATLSRKERLNNLRGKFALRERPPKAVVIFDDVITTGSTLSELAKLAKKRGAKEVWAAVLAHD